MAMSLYTSFLFLFPTLHALFKQKYLYSLAFLMLTATSFFLRTTEAEVKEAILLVDRFLIATVILLGSSYLLSVPLEQKIVPILMFVAVWVIIGGGYCFECFFYDKDDFVNDCYQAAVHCLSVLGHHGILLSIP
jgi:hypothetical protein